MNIGEFNRQIYDPCNYDKKLYESTSPLMYNMMFNKYEHCDKTPCNGQRLYPRFDPAIVDVESELKNITRPLSDCDEYKYSPTCKKSKRCISTFDKSVPVVFVPEVCPIVRNNIPKTTNTGYRAPNMNIC